MTWCPHFTDEEAEASEGPRQRGAQTIAGNLEHTRSCVHGQRASGAAQVHQLETAEPFPEPFPMQTLPQLHGIAFFLSHTHQGRRWLISVLTNTHSCKWARYIQMCEHNFTTATQKYICSPASCKVSVPSRLLTHLYKPQTHTDSTRKHTLFFFSHV